MQTRVAEAMALFVGFTRKERSTEVLQEETVVGVEMCSLGVFVM
jgi:hypothetical protein